MIIKLIEPLNIKEDKLNKLARNLVKAGHQFFAYPDVAKTPTEQKQRLDDADIAMIANHKLTNGIIAELPNLRMISVAFTGVDHVGLQQCKKQNILVSNSAGYSDIAVAEITIGLTIDVLRNITLGDAITRAEKTSNFLGKQLRGKTVGIIGLGRIGKEVAKLFKAFGCNILAYTTSYDDSIDYIKKVELDKLLNKSDIISLHLPMNKENAKFIDKAKIDLMKPSAVLINCARGGVVETNALATALNNEKIAGAGIDVFDMEPPIPTECSLVTAKNTVLTPHIAYATEESMIARAEITFDNVYAFLEGKPINTVKL